jgi:hypothetical protein
MLNSAIEKSPNIVIITDTSPAVLGVEKKTLKKYD